MFNLIFPLFLSEFLHLRSLLDREENTFRLHAEALASRIASLITELDKQVAEKEKECDNLLISIRRETKERVDRENDEALAMLAQLKEDVSSTPPPTYIAQHLSSIV